MSENYSDKTLKISLFERFMSPSISTRLTVEILKEELKNTEFSKIILDFSKIETISRSVAHEIIILKFDLYNLYQKDVVFDNTNSLISELLETVTDHNINSKQKVRNVSERKVDFEELCTMAF